jgi:hypothetical protein
MATLFPWEHEKGEFSSVSGKPSSGVSLTIYYYKHNKSAQPSLTEPESG